MGIVNGSFSIDFYGSSPVYILYSYLEANRLAAILPAARIESLLSLAN